MDQNEILENRKKSVEIEMKKCIKSQGESRKMVSALITYPEYSKERIAAEYWRGRLSENVKRFKELSQSRLYLENKIRDLK